MTKEEYYNISREQKLPLRCPCLNNCTRYRFTAYLIGKTAYPPRSSEYEAAMRQMGILGDNESLNKMLEAGEPVTMSGGNSSFYITNACPEFFLHDHDHKMFGMGNVATHQFSYDEYYKHNKYKPGESRHYTECAEYSLSLAKRSSSRRKAIPGLAKVKAELQKEISSKCPFCDSLEVGHFEIHHIDEDPANNAFENLLMLCPTCHSKITKGDISRDDVIHIKYNLAQSFAGIEFVNATIDAQNCNWEQKDEFVFFQNKSAKSPFPIISFTFINHTKKTVVLKAIKLNVTDLPRGINGIPKASVLGNTVTYKLCINEKSGEQVYILDNPLQVPAGQAAKFSTELYERILGDQIIAPDGRKVLDFKLEFSQNISLVLPAIFLNCKSRDEKLTLYIRY